MARTVLCLLLLVFLCGLLYGVLTQGPSPHLRTGERNKTKVFVGFVLFRNLADYDVERSSIAVHLLGTDAALEGSTFGKHPTKIKVEDQVVVTRLVNEQSSDIKRGKYNLITENSKSGNIVENERNDYQTNTREIDKKQISGNGLLLKKHSIGSKTDANGDKLKSNVLDEMVDFLLQIVRDELHETGRDQIAIPNVDEQFSTDIVFIPVKGRFRAEDGWFRNLSTIYRTGEVDVTTSRYAISVEFELGLKTTQFGYQEYTAELIGIQVSGSLTGSIASDSIATKISLAYVNGTCKAHLDSLKVTILDGISVELTGGDGIGWLLTFIANCEFGSYRNQIIYAVEQTLSSTLEAKLDKFNCGRLFPSTLVQGTSLKSE